MTHTLHCEIGGAEGSLQRLIGLIDRRGFDIASMDMGARAAGEPTSPSLRRRIALDVRPRDEGRCVVRLGRQIDRLYGVRCLDAGPHPQPT